MPTRSRNVLRVSPDSGGYPNAAASGLLLVGPTKLYVWERPLALRPQLAQNPLKNSP